MSQYDKQTHGTTTHYIPRDPKLPSFYRREEWKQKNPRDQLVAILMASHGFIENLANDMYTGKIKEERHKTVQNLLADAVNLTKLVNGEWPE